MTEIRATGTATRKGGKLVGVAAPFNSDSVDLGGFVERIRPGAFARTLKAGRSIAFLHNHDTAAVVGSTGNGSLKLRETERGLEFELNPADTGTGRDLLKLAERGDVAQMSFGFRVNGPDGQRWQESRAGIVRELIDLELFEVSSTAFPAYPASTVSTRADDPAARMREAQQKREAQQQAARQRDRRRKRVKVAEAAVHLATAPAPPQEPLSAIRARAKSKARALASK